MGKTVGIIANQLKVMAGCLDINASDKSSRFIRFCDAFNIPILNLVDVPGFLPGTTQEYGGIIRHGAKMLYAYSEASVPKVTLVLRKAYGSSYLSHVFKGSWCRSSSLLGQRLKLRLWVSKGVANIIFKNDPDSKAKTDEYVKNFATPYQAAKRGFVDMVIEPQETRSVLINTFSMLASKRQGRPAKRHGNFPV